MFLPHSFATVAFLVAAAGPAAAGFAAAGPAAAGLVSRHLVKLVSGQVPKTFPFRRFDHYDKESRDAPVYKTMYYEKILDQCKVEATDNNYRVIINVQGSHVDDLKVFLEKNYMIAEQQFYEQFLDVVQGKKVLNKMTFIEVRTIPVHSVTTSAKAKLTSNGYLVVDIPIDPTAEPSLVQRNVPVVYSAKPLKVQKVVHTEEHDDNAYLQYSFYGMFKALARYYNVNSSSITTEDLFRVIVKAENNTKDTIAVKYYGGMVYIYNAFAEREVQPAEPIFDSHILPPHSVAASITATLTSDGFLVIDVPIDKNVTAMEQDTREVPVVESEETMKNLLDLSVSEGDGGDKNDKDNDIVKGSDDANDSSNNKINNNESKPPT